MSDSSDDSIEVVNVLPPQHGAAAARPNTAAAAPRRESSSSAAAPRGILRRPSTTTSTSPRTQPRYREAFQRRQQRRESSDAKNRNNSSHDPPLGHRNSSSQSNSNNDRNSVTGGQSSSNSNNRKSATKGGQSNDTAVDLCDSSDSEVEVVQVNNQQPPNRNGPFQRQLAKNVGTSALTAIALDDSSDDDSSSSSSSSSSQKTFVMKGSDNEEEEEEDQKPPVPRNNNESNKDNNPSRLPRQQQQAPPPPAAVLLPPPAVVNELTEMGFDSSDDEADAIHFRHQRQNRVAAAAAADAASSSTQPAAAPAPAAVPPPAAAAVPPAAPAASTATTTVPKSILRNSSHRPAAAAATTNNRQAASPARSKTLWRVPRFGRSNRVLNRNLYRQQQRQQQQQVAGHKRAAPPLQSVVVPQPSGNQSTATTSDVASPPKKQRTDPQQQNENSASFVAGDSSSNSGSNKRAWYENTDEESNSSHQRKPEAKKLSIKPASAAAGATIKDAGTASAPPSTTTETAEPASRAAIVGDTDSLSSNNSHHLGPKASATSRQQPEEDTAVKRDGRTTTTEAEKTQSPAARTVSHDDSMTDDSEDDDDDDDSDDDDDDLSFDDNTGDLDCHDDSDQETVAVEAAPEEQQLPESMTFASSVKVIDEDGLPLWRFSVYGGDDSILYDFTVTIDESGIPNSGLGAFLTYMGARRLRSEKKKALSDRILQESKSHVPDTMEPLQAVLPSGRGVTVTLTGENLHGNHNSIYWPRTQVDLLEASIPKNVRDDSLIFTKATETVRLVGHGIDSHPELEQANGIGHLGLYDEDDYEPVGNVPFCESGCIDLGTYGPLDMTDQKEFPLYQLKSFLFSNGPSEWAYDVAEEFRGNHQVIDITDDLTGEPHANARKEIGMYVNEVGHTTQYAQNTFVGEKDNRTVHYFFKSDQAMRGDESVELLTDYKLEYEDSRERKGYALKSEFRRTKTDADLGARLKRNFVLRKTVIENAVDGLSLFELSRHLTYVAEKIWEPLFSAAKGYVELFSADAKSSPGSPLSCLQWRALIRSVWLRELLKRRLGQLVADFQDKPNYKQTCGIYVATCNKMLNSMEAQKRLDISILWTKQLLDANNENIGEAVLEECIESILYSIRHRIRRPFDNSLWCRVASDLTKSLCKNVLRNSASEKQLANSFFKTAEAAMKQVSDSASTGDLKQLSFGPGTFCKGLPHAVLGEAVAGIKDCFSHVGHDATPKALSATIAALLDEKKGGDAQNLTKKCRLGAKGGFLMTKSDLPFRPERSELRPLASVVRPCALVRKEGEAGCVNTAWYHVWQVLYVVHAYAVTFTTPGAAATIIGKLCRSFDLDPAVVKFAVNQKIVREKKLDFLVQAAKTFEKNDLDHFAAICRQAKREEAETNRQAAGDRTQQIIKECKRVRRKRKQELEGEVREEERLKPWGDRATAFVYGAKNKVKKKKSPSGGSTKEKKSPQGERLPPKEIYCGPPTIPLPNGVPWPEGWIQKTYERQSGASKGGTDSYWFSPQLGKRLRSKSDVLRFLAKLEAVGGDERALVARFKAA